MREKRAKTDQILPRRFRPDRYGQSAEKRAGFDVSAFVTFRLHFFLQFQAGVIYAPLRSFRVV